MSIKTNKLILNGQEIEASPTGLSLNGGTISGGSASVDRTANWSSNNTNLVIIGDSISAGLSSLIQEHPAFTPAKCNLYNTAISGGYVAAPSDPSALNIFVRYNNLGKAHRPEANGGDIGITRSIMIVFIGTNNDFFIDGPQFKEWLTSFVQLASNDGFEVWLTTNVRGIGFNANEGVLTPEMAQRSSEYNIAMERIQSSLGNSGQILPWDKVVYGPDDPYVASDKVHLTSEGAEALVRLWGNSFMGLPLERTAFYRGNHLDGLVTHRNLGVRSHVATRPQGIVWTSLLPDPITAWPVLDIQNLRINLDKNVLFSVYGPIAGITYKLLIRSNSYTLTFDTTTYSGAFRFPNDEIPELSADGTYDLLTFECFDGVYLNFVNITKGMDLSPIPEPGVIVEERFLITGAASPGVPLHNTEPDTVSLGGTWYHPGYISPFNLGCIRVYDQNVGAFSNDTPTKIDTGVYDNFEWETTFESIGTGRGHVYFRITGGDSNGDCVRLTWQPQYGGFILYSVTASDVATELWSASTSGWGAGDRLKVSVSGTTINVYKNDTLLTTQASSSGYQPDHTYFGLGLLGATISKAVIRSLS